MNNTMKRKLFNLLTIIFLSTLVLIVLAGATFSFINGLEEINNEKNHIEYIKKEIPNVISIKKDNDSDVIYNSESDKESYIITTKVGKYTISINKEKNNDKSFNYDMQVSSINEERLNEKE